MSYLEDILSSAQGGELLTNLGRRYGLTPEQVDSAIKSLAPALEIGMQNATEHPSVFSKLIGEMFSPTHQAAFDVDDDAHADGTVAQSRDFLSTLFGSEEAAGQIVQVAARDSGVQPDLLSQLLPVLASVLLGGLFKNNQGLGSVLGQLANSGALGQVLGQILGGGAPQSMPMPPQQQGGGLGGQLGGPGGGLLGSILGSIFGRRPPAGGMGPGNGGGYNPGGGMRRGPLDVDADVSGPAGLPSGIDQSSLQQAIEQIKNQLQVGGAARSGGAAQGGAQPNSRSELESIIGQMFGNR